MSDVNAGNLKTEYQIIELEIRFYSKGKWKSFYFLRHILCYLRKNPELCKQSDYKDLYDETVVLLILHAHAKNSWTKKEPADQQRLIELLADLENKNSYGSSEPFSIEMIDDYLAYRKGCGK